MCAPRIPNDASDEGRYRAAMAKSAQGSTRPIRSRPSPSPHTDHAWVDDEVSDLDRAWVAAHHQGPALLHRVDSAIGLPDTDLAALDDWLQDIAVAS